MEKRYIHEESVHNLVAPNLIVPLLIKMFHPQSVIDVGCGIGTFLRVFKENGVGIVKGIDGLWVNKQLLQHYIDLSCFEEVNLEEVYYVKKKYDLAVCLEVAEHLKPECSKNIVQTLTELSDIIVFSAAIPYQGGQNHVNEQWPSYWKKLFWEHGYEMLDIIRPILWNNDDVFFWYKQNMFVVVKKDKVETVLDNIETFVPIKDSLSIIHPELYYQHINSFEARIKRLEKQQFDIVDGNESYRLYLKMFRNYIFRKLHLK